MAIQILANQPTKATQATEQEAVARAEEAIQRRKTVLAVVREHLCPRTQVEPHVGMCKQEVMPAIGVRRYVALRKLTVVIELCTVAAGVAEVDAAVHLNRWDKRNHSQVEHGSTAGVTNCVQERWYPGGYACSIGELEQKFRRQRQCPLVAARCHDAADVHERGAAT